MRARVKMVSTMRSLFTQAAKEVHSMMKGQFIQFKKEKEFQLFLDEAIHTKDLKRRYPVEPDQNTSRSTKSRTATNTPPPEWTIRSRRANGESNGMSTTRDPAKFALRQSKGVHSKNGSNTMPRSFGSSNVSAKSAHSALTKAATTTPSSHSRTKSSTTNNEAGESERSPSPPPTHSKTSSKGRSRALTRVFTRFKKNKDDNDNINSMPTRGRGATMQVESLHRAKTDAKRVFGSKPKSTRAKSTTRTDSIGGWNALTPGATNTPRGSE